MAAALTLFSSAGAFASSHREAPFITEMPKVDSTDFYMFQSYQTSRLAGNAFTTVIANYQPFQFPAGGPNYFFMDPDALYEIHIDNNGDAEEDLTFQFRFKNTLANGGTGTTLEIGPTGQKKSIPIPLINVGPGATTGVTAANTDAQNLLETYSVKLVRGDRRGNNVSDVTNATGGTAEFRKPLDYIGRKTFGDANGDDQEYSDYANAHIYNINIPGCTTNAATQGRMFVGQRREPFFVNIGPIFDLVNAPADVIIDPAARGAVPNPLRVYNISTIALEIPTSCLLQSDQDPAQPIIGGWQTASVRQARAINPMPTFATPAREGGAWTQVSRVGMPLVNEVVIGLKDKNLFNAIKPTSDGAAADYVTHPTLPALIEALFNSANPSVIQAPKVFPRADLIAVFLSGVPGVNDMPGDTLAEMVRLNTALPPKARALQNNLGAAGCFVEKTGGTMAGDLKMLDVSVGNTACDTAGFPNGRRPGDDVVDIALSVSMGYLFARDEDAPARGILFHDAVTQDAEDFQDAFPYLNRPLPGANNDGT